MSDTISRSLTLDVFCADEDQYRPVRDSIARYRAGCRQMFAVLGLAQAAGAKLKEHAEGVRVTPDGKASKLACAAVLKGARIEKGEKVRGQGQAYQVHIGVGACYEMRQYFLTELYPDALSFVWDSARRQVWTRWTAKDPEFTRAGRGWLVLQGARGLAWFRGVGIELPQATARPSLEKHSLRLSWDKTIGPVELHIGKLDPGRSSACCACTSPRPGTRWRWLVRTAKRPTIGFHWRMPVVCSSAWLPSGLSGKAGVAPPARRIAPGGIKRHGRPPRNIWIASRCCVSAT